MKNKVPSITDVKKILKDKNIGGYNDKRVDGRRIKLLNEPISFKKQKKLQEKDWNEPQSCVPFST